MTWWKDSWWSTNIHIMVSVWTHSGITYPPTEEPQAYRISFPQAAGQLACLVDRYQGWEVTWTGMRVNFVRRSMQKIMVIVEEGNIPHLKCHCCDIIVL